MSPGPPHGRGRGRRPEPAQKKHRTNNEIRISEVRLIDSRGEMVGVVPTKEAIKKADEAGLDLVEIAPNAKPPVCKIVDYGKFLYDLQKKEKAQKKNQAQPQLKEVRFKWRTDTHDFNFKVRHAREFIEGGNKVKASVMFRGREITHKEIGRELLERFVEELSDIAKTDVKPKMEGRHLFVILSPGKSAKPKKDA
jgi:translation initiation factor IF-3